MRAAFIANDPCRELPALHRHAVNAGQAELEHSGCLMTKYSFEISNPLTDILSVKLKYECTSLHQLFFSWFSRQCNGFVTKYFEHVLLEKCHPED